ncbi:Protein cbp3, mitochondrial [Orbilia ellipsospora]|uniref:Protein cbp3, mitochondrial n=1 Tax=Orbilia ellipsospora TaxID=2528407 RepID=A0AAV9XNY5_9PEZI
MSLIEPILPSLRAGLSQSTRHISRQRPLRTTPLSSPSTAFKFERKTSPIIFPSLTTTPIRPLSHTSRLSQTSSNPPAAEEDRPTTFREKLANVVSAVLPKGTKEQYWAYKKTEELFNECRIQGEYNPEEPIVGKAKFWYEDCGLVPCLRTWTHISNLHVWMLMTRIRNLEPRARAKMWQQLLINHYYFHIEELLDKRHGVSSRGKRQKYMKDLYELFRFTILTYDEAFVRGDAWMATAVWRCVFMSKEDMDLQKLAIIVSYIRRVLSGLEKLDEETVLSAQVYFGNPMDELAVVEKFSEGFELPGTGGKGKGKNSR